MEIKEMAKLVYDLATEKGWHDRLQTEDEYIERCCNNLHDEVSELHTSWRNNELNELCDKAEKMREAGIEPLTNKEEEFADIVIRVMDDCMELGVDLESAIIRKHAFNKTRPHRHGGKRS